jgi:hypothetical protein
MLTEDENSILHFSEFLIDFHLFAIDKIKHFLLIIINSC